jgi:membrane-associated phospholipid phosphatase
VRVAAGAFALFLITAALVASGACSGVDQYAVSHLMPWREPNDRPFLAALTLPELRGGIWRSLADLALYPAGFLPSGLIVAGCAIAHRRRGEIAAAYAWCALWIAGNAVELAGKTVVERPALHDENGHIAVFDQSLPSGHTIRALLVAGALAALWRAGRWAYVWAAAVCVALVPLGWHAPLDVVGGVLVAAALLAAQPLGKSTDP